jgi:probable HAF family extracellular repeat protein
MRSIAIRALTAIGVMVTTLPWAPGLRATATDGPSHYAVTDVASFRDGRDLYNVVQINDRGDVLLNAVENDLTTPVVYRDGMPPLRPSAGDGGGLGTALNNQGEIAGLAYESDPNSGAAATRAVVWQHEAPAELSASSNGSSALAMNDAGDVVGWILNDQGEKGYVVWRDGVPEPIDFAATEIDDRGRLAGTVSVPDGTSGDAVRQQAAISDDGVVTDLGTLGGDSSAASDISDEGHVVGTSTTSPEGRLYDDGSRGFLWYQGTMTSLPPLDEGDPTEWDAAYAVNDAGVVVGRSSIVPGDSSDASPSTAWYASVSSMSTAVLWMDGRTFNLNDLISADEGLYLTSAAAINDAGSIAASAVDQAGYTWVVALTPVEPNATTTVATGDSAARSPVYSESSCAPVRRVPSALEERWTYETPGNAQVSATADGIYVSSWVTDGYPSDRHGIAVASLDPVSGQKRWRTVLSGEGLPRRTEFEANVPAGLFSLPHSSPPVVHNHVVVIGVDDGSLYALDADTGDER